MKKAIGVALWLLGFMVLTSCCSEPPVTIVDIATAII